VTPKFAHVKISNTSPTSRITAKKTQVIRIKDEVQFLYTEKEKIKAVKQKKK